MAGRAGGRGRNDGLRYRLEIEGRLSAERIRWLEAEALPSDGARTVLMIRVADQADLHGRLRRIHDLHLRLISVSREEGEEDDDRNAAPEGDGVRDEASR